MRKSTKATLFAVGASLTSLITGSACAHHQPGRWETEFTKLQAPGAIVARAAECDEAEGSRYDEVLGCLDAGEWLRPKDSARFAELLTERCNKGDAGACVQAEHLKKFWVK